MWSNCILKLRQAIILIFWAALFHPVSPSHAATATYTYDELNRVIKEEYENGRVIEYTTEAGIKEAAAQAQRVEAR